MASAAVLGLVVVVVALLGTTPRTDAALVAIANDDAYAAKHDRTKTVLAPGVLNNDFNLLGSSRAVRDAGPSHGTLQLDADGGFRYRPDARFVGTDSFTYHVSGALVRDHGTVTLTVTNSRPVAADDSYVATTGITLSVAPPGVLKNDADADGDALTATKVSDSGSGSVTLDADGSFTYKSGGSFVGTKTFTYQASDGLAASSAVTVTIDVRPPGATATPSPTPIPTPPPTPVPTRSPAPTIVPLPIPTLPIPSLPVPSLPLPSLPVPSVPSPAASATPPPSPGPTSSMVPGETGSAAPSTVSAASAPPSPDPTADGGGTLAGVVPPGGPGTGAGASGGDGRTGRPLTVPEVGHSSVSVGGLSVGIGGFGWLVPAFVLTVPGLLLILIVLAQLAGGAMFLPVARRALAGVGLQRRGTRAG